VSQQGYGVLLTAAGVGALAGSFLTRRITARVGQGTFLILAAIGFGIAQLIPGLWANPFAVGVSFAMFGAISVGWNVVTVSLRQAIVPDELLGRINGAYRLVGLGTMPIGALLGGLLAHQFGLRAPFIFGGLLCLGVGAAMIPGVNNRKVAAARAAAERA
jgi:MFS family permease